MGTAVLETLVGSCTSQRAQKGLHTHKRLHIPARQLQARRDLVSKAKAQLSEDKAQVDQDLERLRRACGEDGQSDSLQERMVWREENVKTVRFWGST